MINILDENYIEFNSELGNIGKRYDEYLADRLANIEEAVKTLVDTSKEINEAAFYNFKYDACIDKLINEDFATEIGTLVRRIKTSKVLPLEEAVVMSKVINTALYSEPSDDDVENIKKMFDNNADINKDMCVEPTEEGKRCIIIKLGKLSNIAAEHQDNVNDIVVNNNPDDSGYLKESLSLLAEISILTEAYDHVADKLKELRTPEFEAKHKALFDKVDDAAAKINDEKNKGTLPVHPKVAQLQSRIEFFKHGGEKNYQKSGFKSEAEADEYQDKVLSKVIKDDDDK